jgi:ATP-dependent Lhr-like helicase
VRVAVRTGDTLAAARQAMTRRPPHVLITTPESLYILLTSEGFVRRWPRRASSCRRGPRDHGSKRGAHLALTLERLGLVSRARAAPGPSIGCSATVSPVEDALAFLTGSTARDPPSTRASRGT